MQNRFKFKAVLKGEELVIVVPVDAVFETGYQINTNIAQKIFENKYPNKCFFSDFLEIIEKQEYISQYSFDCDLLITKDFTNLMQCTGLKDKNGLNRLFEYDIIDGEGIKIGNYYENKDLLKTTTNYLIKRMGTKEWRNSEQEAIKRGCFYAE